MNITATEFSQKQELVLKGYIEFAVLMLTY